MKPFYQDSHVTIYHGDCREILPQLAVGSVHTCVTSPPYFGLRDYQGEHQIGLESTPAAYIAEMTGVFEEVRRALRTDGTAWLNLGDSYNSPSGSAGNPGLNGKGTRFPLYELGAGRSRDKTLKQKDLIGIPWRCAFALQEAGWWLRSDIIWSKPACMPESVTDRPTRSHEYIFLLTLAERYYYDFEAVKEPAVSMHGSGNGYKRPQQLSREGRGSDVPYTPQVSRNRRSVWTVNTQPFAGAHFAVFPEKLIEPCILAGCPAQVCAACGAPWERIVEKGETTWQARKAGGAKGGAAHFALGRGQRETHGNGASHDLGGTPSVTLGWQASCECVADTIPGTVIDPFGGSGTTARVAKRLGRHCILIEQNEQYAEMAAASLAQNVLGLVVS